MRCEEGWNRFKNTGSIYDYLRYKAIELPQETTNTAMANTAMANSARSDTAAGNTAGSRAGDGSYETANNYDRYGTVSVPYGGI